MQCKMDDCGLPLTPSLSWEKEGGSLVVQSALTEIAAYPTLHLQLVSTVAVS